MPMGPPPITATFLLRMGLLKMPGSRCAMPALGLTEQKHSHGVCPSPWHLSHWMQGTGRSLGAS